MKLFRGVHTIYLMCFFFVGLLLMPTTAKAFFVYEQYPVDFEQSVPEMPLEGPTGVAPGYRHQSNPGGLPKMTR